VAGAKTPAFFLENERNSILSVAQAYKDVASSWIAHLIGWMTPPKSSGVFEHTRSGPLICSRCTGCGQIIAASPKVHILRLAEAAHACDGRRLRRRPSTPSK
jgi:hypothetical protein